MELRDHINLVEASTRPAKLETTPLPYGERDLEPVLSKESLEYHYGTWPGAMPSGTMQEKAMQISIVPAVSYTTNFSPNFGLPRVPIDPAVLYLP